MNRIFKSVDEQDRYQNFFLNIPKEIFDYEFIGKLYDLSLIDKDKSTITIFNNKIKYEVDVKYFPEILVDVYDENLNSYEGIELDYTFDNGYDIEVKSVLFRYGDDPGAYTFRFSDEDFSLLQKLINNPLMLNFL